MIDLPVYNGRKYNPELDWINHLGSHIKDYQLKEKIGEGAFGVVFKAECLNTGKIIAIKRISRNKICNSNKVKERVKAEISIHINLQHPSIVPLYKAFQDQDYIYIILENCKCNLVQYIHENGIEIQNNPVKRVDESTARRFLAEIVNGVEYLNRQNVLHRDLKLANTLLSDENAIKIADFGLATQLNNVNKTLCGTPNNMSPEIIRGEIQSKEIDVWSIGVMLYEMLTGKQPFATKNTKDTMEKIKIGEYDLPNYLSQDSSDLIKKCLQYPPVNRISVADMKYHPFLSPVYKGPHSHDSGMHSFGSSNVQYSRIPSRISRYCDNKLKVSNRNMYHPPNSPPVSMKSNPKDLPFNPYLYSPMPSLIPPSAALRSARGYSSSMESLGSAAYPMKANHYLETTEGAHVAYRSENNVQGSDPGQYYKSDRGRHIYSDNVYSDQRMVSLEGNYVNDGKAICDDRHEGSSFLGSRQRSWREQDENMPQKHQYNQQCQPSYNTETPAGILTDIKTSSKENCQSSVVKSHSSRDGISVRDKPPILSSARLKVMREVKEYSVLSILEDSKVCIEYIKNNSSKRRVVEVWKISQDGNNIVVYRPNGKKGLEIGDCPPKEQGVIYRYTYDSLPEIHWKKYLNAYRFAESAKEKTRKIYDRYDEPKACLMENGNFEAEFKNGYKFVFFSKMDTRKSKVENKVSLTKANHKGTYSETHTETYNMDDCSFNEKDTILYEKCCELRDEFLQYEQLLNFFTKKNPDRPRFPCILGSRPDIGAKSATEDTVCSKVYRRSNKENIRQFREVPRRI